jgi:hypothetical protein
VVARGLARNALLNGTLFNSLRHARLALNEWRRDYKTLTRCIRQPHAARLWSCNASVPR